MGWQITGRARVNSESPQAFGVCDRCQFLYNRRDLSWQYEWQFQKIFNRRILVCPTCQDRLQEQLRRIVLPVDPIPIANPRVGEFGSMIISSSPDSFDTIVPSQITVENSSGATLGTIGDRSPLVTQASSLPLLSEIQVTPSLGSSGYLEAPTNTAALNQLVGASS